MRTAFWMLISFSGLLPIYAATVLAPNLPVAKAFDHPIDSPQGLALWLLFVGLTLNIGGMVIGCLTLRRG